MIVRRIVSTASAQRQWRRKSREEIRASSSASWSRRAPDRTRREGEGLQGHRRRARPPSDARFHARRPHCREAGQAKSGFPAEHHYDDIGSKVYRDELSTEAMSGGRQATLDEFAPNRVVVGDPDGCIRSMSRIKTSSIPSGFSSLPPAFPARLNSSGSSGCSPGK